MYTVAVTLNHGTRELALPRRRQKGIQMLKLLRPIYRKTAAYGHFGRDEPEFTWEATDRAQALKAAAGV